MATAPVPVRWRHGKDAVVAVDLGEVVARTEDEIGLKVWLRVNPPPDLTVQNIYDRARAGQLSLSIKADPDTWSVDNCDLWEISLTDQSGDPGACILSVGSYQ
jgi:hypothetical protein